MNIVTVEDLYKSYGEKVLFDGISFQINEKERIGLVGVNGTGKSTLLRVMAGLETTERGKLTHANHFHVEYLPQQPEFDMESTVLEQVFHGDTPIMKALREYEWALAELQLAPEDEKRQAKLFAAQSRMDASGAWDAQTTAKKRCSPSSASATSRRRSAPCPAASANASRWRACSSSLPTC